MILLLPQCQNALIEQSLPPVLRLNTTVEILTPNKRERKNNSSCNQSCFWMELEKIMSCSYIARFYRNGWAEMNDSVHLFDTIH